MRITGLAAIASVFAALAPCAAADSLEEPSSEAPEIVVHRSSIAGPKVVEGEAALEIVEKGNIRTTSGGVSQGFLLLIEFGGRNYACTIASTAQIQSCNELFW